ncbi:aspartic proteinase CDR1-like [Quercus lobata]|uniref:aspartic proteinase CDR1-like n=1 Tax=Quercus lobata TaxID=97700 RepID=UPI0012443F29|nr:aspartic proteinase CDR1-like [Quercus lobata]
MASHHHSLLSLAASATTFSIILLCCFTLIEALNGGFSVDLIYRDSLDSPFYNAFETHSQRVAKALRRSINHVNHFKPSSSVSPNLAQTDIISNSGEYLIKYSVGTPLVAILGIADTGSDLIWLQCKPCPECYNQAAPFFDPKMSTTYKSVSCTSSQCESVGNTSCSNDGTSCQYSVSYDDQSFSNGDLAVDTFTLGSTTSDNPVSLPETIIGCGHDNNGTFSAKGSGIVGLGHGTVSLVSQLSSIGGKFSYCLVPLTSRVEKSSKLNFGSNAVVSSPGTVSTPLVPNSQDTSYFLTLEAMSVGSKRLEMSGSSGSEDLEGNIIIDSGTTLTTLPTEFYSTFESAVAEEIDLERGDDPSQFLSLCYKRTSDSIEIPITAHFTGADVKLNPDTTFIQINEELSCMAFRANQEITIFGNLAQSNLLVGYDLVKKTVSFKPTDCTKL